MSLWVQVSQKKSQFTIPKKVSLNSEKKASIPRPFMPLSLRMSKMRLFQNIFNHNAYRKNDEKDHHDMRFSIPAEKFCIKVACLSLSPSR